MAFNKVTTLTFSLIKNEEKKKKGEVYLFYGQANPFP